jgi:hypothetical protein
MKSVVFQLIIVSVCFLLAHSCPHQVSSLEGPIFMDGEVMEKNKLLIEQNDPTLAKAKEVLMESAQKVLQGDTYSVTYKDKDQIPDGATAHDYVSLAPYMWPDPSKKDGMPFIQKDGRRNPLAAAYKDGAMLNGLCTDVQLLGLAYYFSSDEVYAERATFLLRVFFMDSETKMNPSFDFSQIVMGKKSSGGNVISANHLLKAIDGIQLIKSSKYWTERDQMAMQKWFSSLLDWMKNSPKGKIEAKRQNNIGTFYTIQATTFALFVGNGSLAKKIIEERAYHNIEAQIDKDGKMPLELKRATPWSYVNYNLSAFYDLMKVSLRLGVDLWDYRSEESGSIKQSYEWVESFLEREQNSFSFYGQNIDKGSINKFLQTNPARELRKPSDERIGRRSGRTVNKSNFIDILSK